MKSETMEEHKKKSPIEVNCGIITLSDTKYKDKQSGANTDISGKIIIEELKKKYNVKSYEIIPDEKKQLLNMIEKMKTENIDVILTTGGTGIGSRDITIETVKPLFEKKINGFGEIFRLKSYEKLGSGAMLSRAVAGTYGKTIIFSMPGSPNAVKLGISLIIDELGHLKKHLNE
ncbi:molybdenum cofactor biosynthesis protein B [Methanobrevibacter arboriphilus JCM 13429 = DSM 1125]|uniref:Molybdenum cofactor biosynthesis protein B n=1 Tax=Methanobrevibacter arboriphilus JCM 13429 = DSM 1125 TaxID=1300164 RepID=A0A1V6N107_METAZ|nr:MogA/MoaB family molybdenum cofactor biosynthesis protein [Methanobrevibacter arboriphilus]OQD58243.1 molybdenum cofactor biosynthesis protein B [Methanobrevibacter arboriphilus JCM 13429 = DSM 1125]